MITGTMYSNNHRLLVSRRFVSLREAAYRALCCALARLQVSAFLENQRGRPGAPFLTLHPPDGIRTTMYGILSYSFTETIVIGSLI